MPLDLNQPFGIVSGDFDKAHYVQGGVYYDVSGNVVAAPGKAALTPSQVSMKKDLDVIGAVISEVNAVSGLYFNKAWVGTQAQYDAIATKDANTQYNIVAA